MKFWKIPDNRAAFEHARLSTAYYSKSFYLSSLMLPLERRWATFALYGFCRYADNLIDNPRNRTLLEIKTEIEHLRAELTIAYRTGESEHPVLRPLIISAMKYEIPLQYPLELLQGVEMDLEKKRYQNFDDLYLFCYRVAGVVGLMMTHVLGYKTPDAFPYAEKLGVAMQLTNIIRDIQEDLRLGRLYLPLDELDQFQIEPREIIQEKFSDQLVQLLRFSTERAHRYYQEAQPGIPMLATESQFAIYSASRIYRSILYKFEKNGYNPFKGRTIIPQSRKFRILINEVFHTKKKVWLERLL